MPLVMSWGIQRFLGVPRALVQFFHLPQYSRGCPSNPLQLLLQILGGVFLVLQNAYRALHLDILKIKQFQISLVFGMAGRLPFQKMILTIFSSVLEPCISGLTGLCSVLIDFLCQGKPTRTTYAKNALFWNGLALPSDVSCSSSKQ